LFKAMANGNLSGPLRAGFLVAVVLASAGCGKAHQTSTVTTASSSSSSSLPAATATSGTTGGDPVARGRSLVAQFPCLSCHSTTGARLVGPTWKGLAGSKVRLSDGQTVMADRDYLVHSIEDPDAQIVQGYQKGIMSAVIRPGLVSHDDAEAIAAYIETLRR
jgi:cytochrome c oxidase subunit 2